MQKKLLTAALLSLGFPALLAMFGQRDGSILAVTFALVFLPSAWSIVSAWRRNPWLFSEVEVYKGSWPESEGFENFFTAEHAVGNRFEALGFTITRTVPLDETFNLFFTAPTSHRWLLPVFEDETGRFLCFVGEGPLKGSYIVTRTRICAPDTSVQVVARSTSELAALLTREADKKPPAKPRGPVPNPLAVRAAAFLWLTFLGFGLLVLVVAALYLLITEPSGGSPVCTPVESGWQDRLFVAFAPLSLLNLFALMALSTKTKCSACGHYLWRPSASKQGTWNEVKEEWRIARHGNATCHRCGEVHNFPPAPTTSETRL